MNDYTILSNTQYLRTRTLDVACGAVLANILWVAAGFLFGWFV